jgi:hypothetical protein
VPVAKFGDAAVKAVSEWRVKALPSDDPVCYRNLTTSILFVIER